MNRRVLIFSLAATAPFTGFAQGLPSLSALGITEPSKAVASCHARAAAAEAKSGKICNSGTSSQRVCKESEAIRLKVLKDCRKELEGANKTAEGLYLLGVIHSRFDILKRDEKQCKQLGPFRHQEGSGACVYELAHFDELLAKFRDSPMVHRAAWDRERQRYKYYECEGSESCNAENGVFGAVEFLTKWHSSPLADKAVEAIEEVFTYYASAVIERPMREYPEDGLVAELARIREIAPKLKAGLKERAEIALAKAEKKVAEIQKMKDAGKAASAPPASQ